MTKSLEQMITEKVKGEINRITEVESQKAANSVKQQIKDLIDAFTINLSTTVEDVSGGGFVIKVKLDEPTKAAA